MSYGTRDRRAGAFGSFGGKDGGVDVESLERENELGLSGLSDRVGLLRQAAEGIRKEADSHHTLLDGMDDAMTSGRSTLGAVVDRFKLVMNDKQNRKMTTIVVGTVAALLLLWYLNRG